MGKEALSRAHQVHPLQRWARRASFAHPTKYYITTYTSMLGFAKEALPSLPNRLLS